MEVRLLAILPLVYRACAAIWNIRTSPAIVEVMGYAYHTRMIIYGAVAVLIVPGKTLHAFLSVLKGQVRLLGVQLPILKPKELYFGI